MLPSDLIQRTIVVNSWLTGSWVTEGAQTDPADGAILVDTGQLSAGWYDFTIWMGSSAINGKIVLQHRNSLDTGNVKAHRFRIQANDTREFQLNNRGMEANERLRVISSPAFVGVVEVSIVYVHRGST